ncbi:hypothetical protein EJ110_NYTH12211 [Nymphaea thermarum]|nr:hypothetical protein EJ110_NYTH12211 [Nymphaea thermarum]
MGKKKQHHVIDSPGQEEEETSAQEEEQSSAAHETHANHRMVHIENEVLRIHHEKSDYRKQLSKLNELEEIKEMIRAMSSQQEVSRRSHPGPPPPNHDKGKGVLGGPPNGDPDHLQSCAGPNRPPPGGNNGNNGQYYYSSEHEDRDPGKEARDWVFQVEEYFTCQIIPKEDSLQTSILHFDGEARRWYRWLKHNQPIMDWELFKEAWLLRFGESTYVDYDIELRNLKQTSSVQEYQSRFENLASMVDWTPKSLIAAFIGGLKEEIQIDVRAERNTELVKCFAKARSIEERQQRKLALQHPWRNAGATRPKEFSQPKFLPAPRREEPKQAFKSCATPNMTREEREEMIRNKQCF